MSGVGIPGTGISLGESPNIGAEIGNVVGTVAGLGVGIPGLGIVGSGIGGMIGQAVSNAQAEANTAAAIAQGVPAGSLGFTGQGEPSGQAAPVGQVTGGELGLDADTGLSGGDTGGAAPGTGGLGDTAGGTAPSGGEIGIGDTGDGGGGGAGAGGTVICTELRRQGLMSDEIWAADDAYGRTVDHAVKAGYLRWAPTVAAWMRASRLVTLLVAIPALAWAREMAHAQGVPVRRSWLGRLIMALGIPLCRVLGRVRSAPSVV